MKKDLCFFIRYTTPYDEIYDTIEEHIKLLEEEGRVIWGQGTNYKKRSGINSEAVKTLENQKQTYAYLYNGLNQKLYRGNILAHYNRQGFQNYESKNYREEDKRAWIPKYAPSYYRNRLAFLREDEEALRGDCYIYLEFDSIEELDVSYAKNIKSCVSSDIENIPIIDSGTRSSFLYAELIDPDLEPKIISSYGKKEVDPNILVGEDEEDYYSPDYNLYPETVGVEELYEGGRQTISINRYERNPKARQACLNYYGYDCWVCGLNFEREYGRKGRGFIHVHHIKPLAEIQEDYIIDPIKDLRPVCPNCHGMIHRGLKVNFKGGK